MKNMKFSTLTQISLVFLFAILFSSCSKDKKLQQEEQDLLQQYLIDNNITTSPTASGLYYIETLPGTGDLPTTGQTVTVHYTGTLIDGTKFDSSYDRGQPFPFNLGMGQVIKGWDEGISYMKKDGKATLIIPSELAYGANGAGVIPPYSTLIFTVELINIE